MHQVLFFTQQRKLLAFFNLSVTSRAFVKDSALVTYCYKNISGTFVFLTNYNALLGDRFEDALRSTPIFLAMILCSKQNTHSDYNFLVHLSSQKHRNGHINSLWSGWLVFIFLCNSSGEDFFLFFFSYIK